MKTVLEIDEVNKEIILYWYTSGKSGGRVGEPRGRREGEEIGVLLVKGQSQMATDCLVMAITREQ